ncbi:MAG: FmdB family zinc ribbon protein [Pseudomonadota bacterium]
MPLFDFRCSQCNTIHERLIQSQASETTECPNCGADCKRITVSRFNVAGTKPKTNDASLTASGADFVNNPDSFVKAMDTFGEKVGAPLTAGQKERAVERLKSAKP